MFSRTEEDKAEHMERLRKDLHGATLRQLVNHLMDGKEGLLASSGELDLVYDGINSHGAEITIGDVVFDITAKPRF